MNTFKMSDIQKVAVDAYRGVSNTYSKDQLQDAVRKAIKEVCNGDWNYYSFKSKQYEIFQIMSDLMLVAQNESLAGKYDRFAEFRDTALGDLNYFTVEDNAVYNVYSLSRGNMDIERQKIINRVFSVPTQNKSIKFYDELDNFMLGKIDFGKLTDRASVAHDHYVGQLISDTIYGSYSAVDTDFKATGAFSSSTLNGIIEKVKAANGVEKLQIWGTSTALSSVADGFGYSDNAKDQANSIGYYGTFRGTDLFSLPQAFTAGTHDLAVNTSYIIILPANEKIVKVVFEGIPFVNMADGMSRNDMQPEVIYTRRVGAAALTVPEGKFGIYKFQ